MNALVIAKFMKEVAPALSECFAQPALRTVIDNLPNAEALGAYVEVYDGEEVSRPPVRKEASKPSTSTIGPECPRYAYPGPLSQKLLAAEKAAYYIFHMC